MKPAASSVLATTLTGFSVPELRSIADVIRDAISLDEDALFGDAERTECSVRDKKRLAPCLGTPCTHLLPLLEILCVERIKRPPPQIVWTGPDFAQSIARKTASVWKELFSTSTKRLLIAGYSFTGLEDIFAPVAEALVRGVEVDLFVDIGEDYRKIADGPQKQARKMAKEFCKTTWPRFYYAPSVSSKDSWAKLHAKVVVVDCKRALVGSANFTNLAKSANIELGALVEDEEFATGIEAHFASLKENGDFAEIVSKR